LDKENIMTDTIKNLATPLGWKDTFVRAAKTAIAFLVTGFSLNEAASFDLSSLKVLAFGAAASGGSIILNAVLKWTNS